MFVLSPVRFTAFVFCASFFLELPEVDMSTFGENKSAIRLLINGRETHPTALPEGLTKFIVVVEDKERVGDVRSLFRQHLGASYQEHSVMRAMPMFVCSVDRGELTNLMASPELNSVRQAIGNLTIEPDSIVSIAGGS
mmetsp:Transcript_18426/g.44024  ORF Transcript_18426/g.44024 Transcript_18426/m.44024 type:complete len:138 (-) Transcript_18426:113-526(-)